MFRDKLRLISLIACFLGFSQPALADTSGFEWQWGGEERRWFIETDVVLPAYMWFHKDRNASVRVVSFQLQLVMGCQVADVLRKGWELHCEIENAAIRAAGTSGDTNKVQEILDEVHQKLNHAILSVNITKNGLVSSVDFNEYQVSDVNRQTSLMRETMRLVMARAVAGFDMELPKNGVITDPIWPQYEALLMRSPSSSGSQSSNQIIHRVIDARDNGLHVIETAGKGLMNAAHLTGNLYNAELYAFGVFDVSSGYLRERAWTVFASASAGSAFNEGYQTIPYIQWGRIVSMTPGEQREVFSSIETSAPGNPTEGLPPWVPLSDASADLIGFTK